MKKALFLFLALAMIVACLTGISFAEDTFTAEETPTSIAKIVTGEDVKYVDSVANLAANISSTGESVVTLLGDVTHNEELQIPVCTIDLNGYTWDTTGANSLYFYCTETDADANLKIVVKNGTIKSTAIAVSTNVGYVHFQNVTLCAGTGAFRMLYKSGYAHTFTKNDYTGDNRVENSQLHSATSYGFETNSKASYKNVKLTINDTVVVAESSTEYPFSKGSATASPEYILGNGVDVYAKASAYTDVSASKFTGVTLTQAEGTHNVTVNSATVEGLNKWSTGISAENAESAVLNVISGINGRIAALEPAARGTEVTVNATPDEGYVLSHLVVNGETVEGDTFTVPNTDTVAVFAAFRKAPSTSATLEVVEGENGTITLPVTEADCGTDVTVTAAPAEGYEFSHLLVNGEQVDSLTFTVPGDALVQVQGVFKKQTVSLPVTPSENGTITLPVTEAEYGDEVVVTATPAAGYKLSHLLVGDEQVNGLTFTVPAGAEATVQGVFAAYDENEDAPENAIAKIVTNGGAVYVSTVAEFTANLDAKGESVITLLQDVTASQETQIPPCTINLGGYTWRALTGRALYVHHTPTAEDATNVITRVENGTIIADASSAFGINVGAIQMRNVTLIANGIGGLQMMSGREAKFNFIADADYSKLNSMANCVVYNSAGYGVGFGNDKVFTNVEFNISNTVLISGGERCPIDDGSADAANAAKFILGENVDLYGTTTSYTDIAASITGKTVTKVGVTSVEVAGSTVEDVTRWTTRKVAASIDGTIYDTFEKAIEAAGNTVEETNIVINSDVVLSENVVAANVVLDIADDVNLDLNGNTLQVSSVSVVGGYIVDTTNGTGLLKCAKGSMDFLPDNPQIPIWDEGAVGYRLTDVVHKAGNDEWTEANTFAYHFRFDLADEELNDIFLANQAVDGDTLSITAGVDVYVDGEFHASYAISDETCTETETYIHKIVNNSKSAYKFTLTNAQGANTVEIQNWIMIGGVKHIGGEKTYNNPNSGN